MRHQGTQGFLCPRAFKALTWAQQERILASLEGCLQPNTSLVILDAIPSNAPFVLWLRHARLKRETVLPVVRSQGAATPRGRGTLPC